MSQERLHISPLGAVRALACAIAVVIIGAATGEGLHFLTLNPGWIVVGLIIGIATALPFILRFYRLTKDLLDAAR
jgi:hypothetical protein